MRLPWKNKLWSFHGTDGELTLSRIRKVFRCEFLNDRDVGFNENDQSQKNALCEILSGILQGGNGLDSFHPETPSPLGGEGRGEGK